MEASLTSADASHEQRVYLGLTAIVASEAMRKLFDQVRCIAQSNATVSILGESGSGKELIARAIHHYSRGATRAWVDLSCAALPEQLMEGELFGHEKGAYSGADVAKPGLFEMAHQGTIFLDEIGELDQRMQAKMLRVRDGVPYYRLGGVKKVSSDVRIVAATNQDLEQAAATSSSAHGVRLTVDEMERQMVLTALASTGGHQQRAANQLGISRRTLSRKLKLYPIDTVLVAS